MKGLKLKLASKYAWVSLSLIQMSTSFADMPHLKGADGIAQGNTDGLELFGTWVKAGGTILLVIAMVSLIYQGVNSLASALRELRTENGNISNLVMHAFGAFISMSLGLILGYIGWKIVGEFKVSTLGL